MSDTVACVSVSVWCLAFYLFILLWTWSIATQIRKKLGKKGRIRSQIFNLVGIGLNPIALSLSLSLFGFCHLSPLQQSSSGLVLVHQYLSQSIGTGVGPLCCSCHIGALTISFCFALFKSKQLIDKASHYIYIYIFFFFFKSFALYYYHYYYYFPLKYQDDRNR